MSHSSLHERLLIERLGQRGEGIAQSEHGQVYVPYAVPGDVLIADVDGERGTLGEIVRPGPDRIAPFCPHFGACGGCAVQTLAQPAYAEWKRSLVTSALRHARLDTDVEPLIDAHGAGRRRATFHARFDRSTLETKTIVGYMRARSHDIVEIDHCPILSPDLSSAVPAARRIARTLAHLGKPLDIVFTATTEGLDVDLHGPGKLDETSRQKLIADAHTLDLARLSNHGDVLIERRPPMLRMGAASVTPPPGAFLQATVAGEETLARLVLEAVGNAKRVADLFAGVGTFALRLTDKRDVFAAENDAGALGALARASHSPGLRAVKTEVRDLFRRPLTAAELEAFQAVVFDPPRSGAEAQATTLAAAKVSTVVAVSCSAQTFARDAAILVAGGYVVERITPVDQFRHSPHVEIVGVFRKAGASKKRARLLG